MAFCASKTCIIRVTALLLIVTSFLISSDVIDLTPPPQTGEPFARRQVHQLTVAENSRGGGEQQHKCHGDTPQSPQATSWLPVETDVSWVYSTAHVDPREHPITVIHVTGIMMTSRLFDTSKTILYCQLWNPKTNTAYAVRAHAKGIIERERYTYENFIMTCAFPKGVYQRGLSVLAVASAPCGHARSALELQDGANRAVLRSVHYTVCVCGSLRNNYSDWQRLVEWMEVNHLLGVERTLVYDTDSSPDVQRVLSYYEARQQLETVTWRPPDVSVRKYAHLAMVHDCLMRAMPHTEYVAFLDVDENIAPRRPGLYTWDDMLRAANCQHSSYIAAANSLYHPDWPSDTRFRQSPLINDTWRLYSLLKTKRERHFMPHGDRSKNILRARDVDHLKLHRAFLRPDASNTTLCELPHEVGALFHYRWLYTKIQRGLEPEPAWEVDRSMHRYTDLLTHQVAHAHQAIAQLPH